MLFIDTFLNLTFMLLIIYPNQYIQTVEINYTRWLKVNSQVFLNQLFLTNICIYYKNNF